jgi:hypothetical protein
MSLLNQILNPATHLFHSSHVSVFPSVSAVELLDAPLRECYGSVKVDRPTQNRASVVEGLNERRIVCDEWETSHPTWQSHRYFKALNGLREDFLPVKQEARGLYHEADCR